MVPSPRPPSCSVRAPVALRALLATIVAVAAVMAVAPAADVSAATEPDWLFVPVA